MIDEVLAKLIDHVLVGKVWQRLELFEKAQVKTRVVRGLNGIQIVPRSFDENHSRAFSENVRYGGLYRGVSAAVEDQVGLGAQQPGRVGPQSEVLAPFLSVLLNECRCLSIRPLAYHSR